MGLIHTCDESEFGLGSIGKWGKDGSEIIVCDDVHIAGTDALVLPVGFALVVCWYLNWMGVDQA